MSDLTERERGFWLNGGAHYAAHAADDAIFVVPMERGILDLAAASALVEREGVWDEVHMASVYEQKMGDVVIMSYAAEGRRGGTVYRALCATVYRGGKLVHHQQTPLT